MAGRPLLNRSGDPLQPGARTVLSSVLVPRNSAVDETVVVNLDLGIVGYGTGADGYCAVEGPPASSEMFTAPFTVGSFQSTSVSMTTSVRRRAGDGPFVVDLECTMTSETLRDTFRHAFITAWAAPGDLLPRARLPLP